MHKITIGINGENKIMYAEDGAFLSKVLIENNLEMEHPCQGMGICKKCTVLVNGEKTLSCRYKVFSDITVELFEKGNIHTAQSGEESGIATNNMCLCLDIGTTTMVLSLVSLDEGKIIRTITENNPQRRFASDVTSRIEYASKNGVEKLRNVLLEKINSMIAAIKDCFEIESINELYVAGNTTMLHTFFGVDPSSMGSAPYTPSFTKGKCVKGEDINIKGVKTVISIDGISAFVGADIVAGLGYVGEASDDKWNILIDFGTNAEVVLYQKSKLYCTAAAAGPCFEGVNISSGMSAVEGAICSVSRYGIKTIGDKEAEGICATGLIDAIALMKEDEVIDETGFMEEGEFALSKKVVITQSDIRQFQLAKSAISSAVETLCKKAEIDCDDIENVFVSGGFSAKMNFNNGISLGLFPLWCRGKLKAVNNSCLSGLVKYATQRNDLSVFVKNAEYIDLATYENFQDLFIENMQF